MEKVSFILRHTIYDQLEHYLVSKQNSIVVLLGEFTTKVYSTIIGKYGKGHLNCHGEQLLELC